MGAKSLPAWRGDWPKWLILGGLVVVLLTLNLPWVASAYYLEKGGRKLQDAQSIETDYDVTERALSQAVAWSPRNAQAYLLLAQLHKAQEDKQAAARALQRYVELRSTNPRGHWDLALVCEQALNKLCGSDPESNRRAQIRLWHQAGQSSASFVRAGDASSQAQEWDMAQAWYNRALLLDPEAAEAWYGLGEVGRKQGDLDKALERYAQAIGLSSDDSLTAQAHERRGLIFAQSRHWQEAQSELSQALDLAPEQGEYHLNYGWYLYKAGGDWAEAYAHLTIAADTLPNDPIPHLHLADLERAGGHYSEMLAHAQRALDIEPTLFWSWLVQGQALSRLDRPREAEQSLRRAVELAPDHALPHLELGHVLMQMDQLDEAIDEYERATELAPGEVLYLMSLANAYRVSGLTEPAKATFKKILEIDPENTTAHQAMEELGE